jgi:hypothetical protein
MSNNKSWSLRWGAAQAGFGVFSYRVLLVGWWQGEEAMTDLIPFGEN